MGTPYAEADHVFSVTTTTSSDVSAFSGSAGPDAARNLGRACLGQTEFDGGPPPATVFYSATYTWSGGGTVKGCLAANGHRELYGPGGVDFVESRVTETVLNGGWSSAPGQGWTFQATRADSCGPSRRSAHTSAVNEVRVIAVNPDVAWHKSGTGETEWHDVCKDTVLQQGDEISCDPDGAVTLQFADNSTVVVKNTTQLKIASFFTEGGVVRTEILLKMGEIAAQVHKSEATKSDFKIKAPTGTASVRGTSFTYSYDPGARASLLSVFEGTVEMDPANPKLKTKMVPAGKEVEVTAKRMTRLAGLGKAGARGGVNRRAALTLVAARVAAARAGCGVTTPRLGAYAVKPIKRGWRVTYKVEGKVSGTSKWTVRRKRARAVNALAERLAKLCA